MGSISKVTVPCLVLLKLPPPPLPACPALPARPLATSTQLDDAQQNIMMLVQPADAVTVQPPPAAPALFSLSSLFHQHRPSTPLTYSAALVPSWLALLAAVVLLSSARAALLYAHGRRSRKGKGPAGVVVQEKKPASEKDESQEKDKMDSAHETPSIPTQTPAPAPPSLSLPTVPSSAPSSSTAPTTASPTASSAPARTSWLWGLLSWNRSSLPTLPLPLQVQRSARDFQRLERLQADRGRTISMGLGRRPQDIEQQQMMQVHRGLRSPPAFGSPRFASPPPSNTSYPSTSTSIPMLPSAPASMAKMIMSRHTFRRPTARPPPVRSARVVQYSRKYVPPPEAELEEDEDLDEEELEGMEEGTSLKNEEEREEEQEKLCV